ncbi:MAG: hypothetical protein HYR96_03785 [Deltaproteobacteria bacterium]|nr:hypothetical protein [Deltaproteobacteria bacterium]MBI3295309.1 hypothetical protein [Deltaproteobacteria bacterium]
MATHQLHRNEGHGRVSALHRGKSNGSAATTIFERGQEIAEEVAEGVAEKAAGMAEAASSYATQARKTVGSTVKKYPLQSLAVGFGLGCVAGILFGRK